MSNDVRSFVRVAFVGALTAVSGVLSGCGDNPLPGAIAQAEQFDFNYVLLQRDANGNVTLRMNPDTVCRDYQFSESELVDMLRTKQFVRNARTLQFRFEAIEACQGPSEVKFETAALSEPFTDANGNPGRRRPHNQVGFAEVVAELSSGGVMQVDVFGARINGTTASRTAAPGPIDVSSAEVAPVRVSSSASAAFAHTNVSPTYVEAQLTNVLATPARFTASFAFLAKADPAGNELLLVWDGDIVLRTDIED